jgi:hypothetical protein
MKVGSLFISPSQVWNILTDFHEIWYGRYVIRQENKRTKRNNKTFCEERIAYFPLIRHGLYKKIKKDTQTRRQQGYLINLLLLFQDKKSRLKTEISDTEALPFLLIELIE